jgi:Tfp pilus assembly protein PilO
MSAKKLFYIIAGGGGLAILIASLSVWWLWGQVHTASTNKLVSEASLDQISIRLNSLSKLDKTYSSLKTTMAKLDQALPPALSSELVTASVEGLANNTHVALSSIEFTSGAATNTVASNAKTAPSKTAAPTSSFVASQVKISGNYSQVMSFLSGVNTLMPLTDITSINLSKPQKEQDQMDVNLQMVSYGSR